MKRQGKQLPLRFCAIVTLEVRASCCWLSWWGLKPGYPILNLDLSSNNGVALYDILKNGKTQEYTVSWKSHGYYVWDEEGVIVNYLSKMREWTSTVIETLRSLYACLYWVHPAIKMSNVLLLHDYNATFKCMHQRPSQVLYGQCHYIHPTFLTLNNQIITCLVIWKEACEGTIILMTKHCSSGFREREQLLLFAQRSQMEMTLKNDFAFSNAVVKLREIFLCPAFKEHETKLGFITFDCFLHTICLLNCVNCVLWHSVSGF